MMVALYQKPGSRKPAVSRLSGASGAPEPKFDANAA